MSGGEESPLRILTSVRFDATKSMVQDLYHRHFANLSDSPCLLHLHRDRLVASAVALGWSLVATQISDTSGINQLAEGLRTEILSTTRPEYLSTAEERSYKIRFQISQQNEIEIDSTVVKIATGSSHNITPFMPVSLSSCADYPSTCRVFVDSRPAQPSVFTTHKTSVRDTYDSARHRAGVSHMTPDLAEVLLWNPDRETMEASLSTPYFLRNRRWVTPPLSSGGNAGVTRQLALENHLCVEELVEIDSLWHGEPLWISNGVRGFVRGFLHFDPDLDSKISTSTTI